MKNNYSLLKLDNAEEAQESAEGMRNNELRKRGLG
jgi:hypothetical protein